MQKTLFTCLVYTNKHYTLLWKPTVLLIYRRKFPGLCSSRTSRGQPLPKKQKMAGYIPAKKMFVPKETWTHDFCLLGRQEENITPSRERLNKLLDAGLGKAHLSIKKNASHEELACALEERFPKLKSGGGFEVLRAEGGGGGQRQLRLVYPGAFGYTAPHLKDRLGQALAYIRPLQADLDEEPDVPEITFMNDGENILSVKWG